MSGVVAVVPAMSAPRARAGAPGLPECGQAPTAETLTEALELLRRKPGVDRVVVVTDNVELRRAAEQSGARAVFYEPTDELGSSKVSAVRFALGETAPDGASRLVVVDADVQAVEALTGALLAFGQQGVDSLFGAVHVEAPAWRLGATGWQPLVEEPEPDLGGLWLEKGSLYVLDLQNFGGGNGFLTGKVGVFPLAEPASRGADKASDLSIPSSGDPVLFERVELLALDFDGVMTDDRVLVDQNGIEAVLCHRGDGLGIERWLRAGGQALVLSKEKNPVVSARCRKLGLPCHQGYDHKLPQLQKLVSELALDPSEVAFMGNDINDLTCMGWVGLAIAVADAHPEVAARADLVTRGRGGRGAVREVCEQLIAARSRAGR